MNRQSAATATAIRPHRRRVLLGLCLAGALLTVVTLVLTWQGRTASRAAVRLAGDDAVLVASVAEVRALLVWVRLDAERATMYPANPEPATRFRTHAAALAEELRRARLHAADPATADVIDDLENRSLAFRESAGLLADALPAAKPEQAAATLAALDQSGAEMQELADELVTAAGAGLERRAAAAAGTMPWWIDGAVAVIALGVAVVTGVLLWVEDDGDMAAAPAAIVPDDWDAALLAMELDGRVTMAGAISAADDDLGDPQGDVAPGETERRSPDGDTEAPDGGDEAPKTLWRPKAVRPPSAPAA